MYRFDKRLLDAKEYRMELTKELRSLVKHTVAIQGKVLQRELGTDGYEHIENVRASMADLRKSSDHQELSELQKQFKQLNKLSSQQQSDIAHAFTLMLELINSCENAYRSHRISLKNSSSLVSIKNEHDRPSAIVYVLTAHPTEARSPRNIAIFHEIQNLLLKILDRNNKNLISDHKISLTELEQQELLHLLELAWRTPIVRSRVPKVKDEAEHIYSLLFRDNILFSLIKKDASHVPFLVRTWVGSDKDGHPGVNEVTLMQSLNLSRQNILKVIHQQLVEIKKSLTAITSVELLKKIIKIEKNLGSLRVLKSADAKRVQNFTKALQLFNLEYENEIGAIHPSLSRISDLLDTFPTLVVPLELRESSDVLMSDLKGRPHLAIYRMLLCLEKISRGGNARSYARGFIISMTQSIEHIKTAAEFQQSVFKKIPLPIIPLFEESASLANSESIMNSYVTDTKLKSAAFQLWGGQIEMMVGYSDSAKEAGVLASRVAIATALPKLEKVCQQAGLNPIFFHGSGGSVDRGGGSIEDQTAWWPKSALRYYKVTVQGEMIERSLATPAIAKRQIDKIIESAAQKLTKSFTNPSDETITHFAKNISKHYRQTITAEDFLKLVEFATPYSYLKVLKIGSRPAKRATQISVQALRAIPWVMCWTQTRVLFPTWWGAGSAWEESSANQKNNLRNSFTSNPVFTSYIKALGFTLAKIELNIWTMYLLNSHLSQSLVEKTIIDFKKEYELTRKCYEEITGQSDLLWFRSWLGESIRLRSPMIHPLNLLQIIAKNNNDLHLLRVTTTGISSGMLTTG